MVKFSPFAALQHSVGAAFIPLAAENPCDGPASYPQPAAAMAGYPAGDPGDPKPPRRPGL